MRSRLLNALLLLYLFIFVFSVPMLMFDLVPMQGRWMGGFLLVLQGAINALWLTMLGGARGALASALIAILSFAVEYLGVSTGVPFGTYVYTAELGVHIGAVPLAIPFAWLTVVPGALTCAVPLRRALLIIPAAALLALLLDMVLEPVVTNVLGYWQWQDGGPYYGIPTANFLAWGGTAFVLLLILHALVPAVVDAPIAPSVPRVLFLLNLAQFTLVNLAYGFWGAVVVGVTTMAIIWQLWGRPTTVPRVPRMVHSLWKELWTSI